MKDPAAGDRAEKQYGGHPQWQLELVDRVASGSAFKKSPRLRELLLFLCERAVSDPSGAVHEQEIGNKVFGRPADYDTTEDPLVRVQVSQLRRKLQQHFESEGMNEAVTIEIPKGCYTPVFRERQGSPRPAVLTWTGRFRVRGNPLVLLLAVLAAVFFLTSVWLVLAQANPGSAIRAVAGSNSARDRFWLQVFGGGRPACLVPSDSTFLLFERLIGRRFSLDVYRRGLSVFDSLADEHISDGEMRAAARLIVSQSCTPFADARLLSAMESQLAAHRIRADVVFPRYFTPAYFGSHTVVLLGNARANRWLELFEHQLNFRSRVDGRTQRSYFENQSPITGEATAYHEDERRHLEYCSLAFLPNPPRDGNVLLISGTAMRSVHAAQHFLSSERWVQELRSRLGLGRAAPLPHFEVLLEVEVLPAQNRRFKIVAHRSQKTEDLIDPPGAAPN